MLLSTPALLVPKVLSINWAKMAVYLFPRTEWKFCSIPYLHPHIKFLHQASRQVKLSRLPLFMLKNKNLTSLTLEKLLVFQSLARMT